MSCPHCNSPVSVTDRAGNPWYACGTTKTFRSASCVDREPLATELRIALARIKRLEQAGDRMKAWLRGNARDGSRELSALRQWNKAKEAKP